MYVLCSIQFSIPCYPCSFFLTVFDHLSGPVLSVQVSVVIPMNLQLVILDFYPADPNDVQRLLTACAERKLDEVEEILQRRAARLMLCFEIKCIHDS